MGKTPFETLLRQCFRGQVEVLGRIFAKHQVPEEAIWEVVRELDVLYQKVRRELGGSVQAEGSVAPGRQPQPHAAILRLLDKLDREASR